MTTTSIKEALDRFDTFLNNPPDYEAQRMVREYRHEAYREWSIVRDAMNAALATLSPQAGERREAIARLIDDLLQADCDLEFADHSNRETAYRALKSARLALDTAIDNALASGLVQDEAAIRKDEREKCAKICDDQFTKLRATWRSMDAGPERATVAAQAQIAKDLAAAIRSARDGGAES